MNNELVKKIKLKDIDVDSFYTSFLREREPVLITNIFEQFPELANWDTDYLIEKVGDKNIKVNVSNNGVFALNPETGVHDIRPVDMSVKEYINAIVKKSSKGKVYAQQISILTTLPELKEELKFMDYIPNNSIHSANIWFGPGGNTSLLHFDGANNFFIQLLGDKKISLYSPKYFYSLYPSSWMSKACYLSQVNPANPDYTKYPNILKVPKIELTVPRGNILFLPAYWWHQVYSINTSISVNIWCKPGFRQKLVPAHLHSSLNGLLTIIRDQFSETKKLF